MEGTFHFFFFYTWKFGFIICNDAILAMLARTQLWTFLLVLSSPPQKQQAAFSTALNNIPF